MTTQQCFQIFNQYKVAHDDCKDLVPEAKEKMALWFATEITARGYIYLSEVYAKIEELRIEYMALSGSM